MFAVVGIINALIGACVVIYMPASPLDAKWLSKEEKLFAVRRLVEDQMVSQNVPGAKFPNCVDL